MSKNRGQGPQVRRLGHDPVNPPSTPVDSGLSRDITRGSLHRRTGTKGSMAMMLVGQLITGTGCAMAESWSECHGCRAPAGEDVQLCESSPWQCNIDWTNPRLGSISFGELKVPPRLPEFAGFGEVSANDG